MPTLHIEHAIADLPTWRRAFDRLADVRARAGVTGHRVTQPVEDDHYIVIDLDFDTVEQTAGFLTFLHEQVWATRDRSRALVGAPRARILRPAPTG